MKKILLSTLACILLSGCSGVLGETEYYVYGTEILKDKSFYVNEYNSRGEIVRDLQVNLDGEGRSSTIVADKSTTSVEVVKKSFYKFSAGTDGKVALKKGETTMISPRIYY